MGGGIELTTTLKSRDDIRRTAEGIIAETFQRAAGNIALAVAHLDVMGSLIGLKTGDVVTNISAVMLNVGSGLTRVEFGLYALDGTLLGTTGDIKAAAAYSLITQPLTTPYTVTADAGFYLVLLSTATTTSASWLRGYQDTETNKAIGAGAKPSVTQAGQTSLPATATFANTPAWLWLAAS